MSFALEFTSGALRGLRALDPWLQEETLDEIDAIAARPHVLKRRGRLPRWAADFTRVRGGAVHYVFLVVGRDDALQVLSVRRIGYHAKPARPGDQRHPPAQ